MFILADKRIPEKAKYKLEKYGELLFVETYGITYPAISGHPDIFFCKTPDRLFIAPNTPKNVKQQLIQKNIRFIEGKTAVGHKYPESAHYNAVVTDNLLVHNLQQTDAGLSEACKYYETIHVNQGYTRCNLMSLNHNRFITSDRGIEKTLNNKGYDVLFVHPEGILLPGFAHGFFGGCCGVNRNRLFMLGSLAYFPDGKKIWSFAKDLEIIELYDGPLFDGGSLIFMT